LRIIYATLAGLLHQVCEALQAGHKRNNWPKLPKSIESAVDTTLELARCFCVLAARQRCLAHRMRNLAAKVPEDVWPEFKVRVQATYQAPSRAIARELAAGVVADYDRKYDSAVACFTDDFEACIAHFAIPGDASAGDPDNEFTGTPLWRGTPSSQDHSKPSRLEIDVRRAHPRCRALALDQGH
jgi:hypothetical protein